MAQKRPFDEEVVGDVSSKHQRHDDAEIVSHDDGFSKEADIVEHHDSDDSNVAKADVKSHDDREHFSCPDSLHEGIEETLTDAPRSISLPRWASTSDEDDSPEEMLHVPFYSGYFRFDRPVKPAINPDDIYHCLLDYPPRKRVPIGLDHQAEIPLWGESTSKQNSGENDINLKLTCIIPNPEIQPLENNILKVGQGRIECQCQDQNSISCVRLHIAEARDKLKSFFGRETFVELGFNDMGEIVADKWTNVEEQLFHEVVYSNPVSLGINFWNVLSAVFPSRTKMEIVSYYFNVFMLRKRAEQNRCHRMNIDSDNDEWEGSVNEGTMSDDDDDSGIESPTHHNCFVFHKNELRLPEHEQDDGNVSDDAPENSEKTLQGYINKTDVDTSLCLLKKTENGGENDAQDGSCTSSDSGASVQETRKTDGCHEWHEDYMLDSNGGKAWDGYISCPKNDVDFLPTCTMIEEVFGGDLESKEKHCKVSDYKSGISSSVLVFDVLLEKE